MYLQFFSGGGNDFYTKRAIPLILRRETVTLPNQPDLEIVLSEAKPPTFSEELIVHVQKLLEANALGSCVFATDDCQKTYEELSAKGIEFLKPPTKEFYGTEALFRDGCGNWFSLTERTIEN